MLSGDVKRVLDVREAREAQRPDREQKRNYDLALERRVDHHSQEIHGQNDPGQRRPHGPEDVADQKRPQLMAGVFQGSCYQCS